MISIILLLIAPFCYLSTFSSYLIAIIQFLYLLLNRSHFIHHVSFRTASLLLLVFLCQLLFLPWSSSQSLLALLLNWIRLLFSCLTFISVQNLNPQICTGTIKNVIRFSVAPLAIILIYHSFTSDLVASSSYPFKLSLWLGESNILCIYTILPLIIGISITNSKPCARGLFIIALIIIQLSFSSSWIGVLLGTFLLNYRKLLAVPYVRGIKSLSLLIYPIISILILSPILINLFAKAIRELSTISIRSASTFAAFPSFLQSPFIGYGGGLTDSVIRQQASNIDNYFIIKELLDSAINLNIMNSFLEILFEYGFITFFVLLIFISRQFYGVRLPNRLMLLFLLLPAIFVPGLLFSFVYVFYLSIFIRLSRYSLTETLRSQVAS